MPLDKSADVLQERGRELVEKYGYQGIDSYSAFTQDSGYINFLKKNDQTPERWRRLAAAQPAVLQFWYRTSPKPLIPLNGWQTTANDPPQTVPGMARLRLDTKGRLIFFNGVPPRVDEPPASTGEFDWGKRF